jgi:peroxiredoxin Q/BCP
MWIIENIWLILFFVWGIPLTYYRSKFRKMVYQTDSWTINIKPVFMKELRAIFSNIYPDNKNYLKFRNFYRFYLIIYLVLFGSYFMFGRSGNESGEKIEVGSTIPTFSLPDQYGEIFDISEVLGTKNLVIYFYPKDDSPGCTKQACSFRDQYEDFVDLDAMVIGISSDDMESHKAFAEKHQLNFTLLSDEDGAVRDLFGVPKSFLGLLEGRTTYIIDKNGKVVYIFNSQLQAEKHITEALQALQAL